MDIVVMKLSTGEEVIANKTGENSYEKIRVFQVMHDGQQVRAGLMPWIMSDPDAEVTINNNSIITTLSAPLEMEQSYLKQTSKLDLSTTF